MQYKFNILIASGATGGHIYPAIAVADFLKEDNNIIFTGGRRGMESEIIKEKGYEFYDIHSFPWVGRSVIEKIKAIILILLGVIKAIKLILQRRVKIILGSGSYASVPVIIGGLILRVPIVVLEEDIKPGMTTKIFHRFAKVVCLANRGSKKYLSKQTDLVLTGTPLRKGFGQIPKEMAKHEYNLPVDAKVIFVFGGSQGSQKIENVVFNMINKYDFFNNIYFLTVSGKFSKGLYKKLSKEKNNVIEKKYIKNMQSAYSCSDIVISRAGALTIAELKASNIPSILIPISIASGHQKYNAEEMGKNKMAVIIENNSLNCDKLYKELKNLLENPKILEKMSQRMEGLNLSDAAFRVSNIIKTVVKYGKYNKAA